MEHRWGKRVAVDITVRVSSRPYAVRAGRLVCLSMSGGGIKVPFDHRVLSRVQVAISLPQRYHQTTRVISAYVTRKFKDGVGVEWCDFAPRPVVELLRWFAPSRNDPHPAIGSPGSPAETFLEMPYSDASGSSRRHGT